MRFKYLLATSILACSLVSCSDDNGGVDIPDYKEIETSVSLSGLAFDEATTKTKGSAIDQTETGSEGERYIHTLTAILFYEDDGRYAAMKTVTSDGSSITSIENVVVKVKALEAGEVSPTQFNAVLIANVAGIPQPANLDAFRASHFEGIRNHTFMGVHPIGGASRLQYLPMASAILTGIKGLVAGSEYNNWVEGNKAVTNTTSGNKTVKLTTDGKKVDTSVAPGDVYSATGKEVLLTRLVARIQLEKLSVNFTENLKGASFELVNVALANVSNASKFCSDDSFQHIIGQGSNGAYDKKNAFFRGYPAEFTREDYWLAQGTYSYDAFQVDYVNYRLPAISSGNSVTFRDRTVSQPASGPTMAQFYAFECDGYEIAKDNEAVSSGNTAYTSLIITGKILNAGIEGYRSFRIPIKEGSLPPQVKRNNVYKVSATITGVGTPNPDQVWLNASVGFEITVEPWAVMNQTESDKN